MTGQTVSAQVEISASPAQVWNALTEVSGDLFCERRVLDFGLRRRLRAGGGGLRGRDLLRWGFVGHRSTSSYLLKARYPVAPTTWEGGAPCRGMA